MRMMRSAVIATGMLLACSLTAEGTTLLDHKHEWAFALSRVDQNNVGTTTTYGVNWSHIVSGGHVQFGLTASGVKFESDDQFLQANQTSSTAGGLFAWNWTPQRERATGFLVVTVQGVGGDLGTAFDSFSSVGVGAKMFVGNSAAVHITYEWGHFQGTGLFKDQDQNSLVVGLALYALKR